MWLSVLYIKDVDNERNKEMSQKEITRSIKIPTGHAKKIKDCADENNRSFLGQMREIIKQWVEGGSK